MCANKCVGFALLCSCSLFSKSEMKIYLTGCSMSSADYCSNSEQAPAKKHKLSYKGQFRGFKDFCSTVLQTWREGMWARWMNLGSQNHSK